MSAAITAPHFTMSSMLEQSKAKLQSHIEKYIVLKTPRQESCGAVTLRTFLRIASLAAAFFANIPYYKIPLEYAGDNRAWGITLTSVASFTWGALIFWCLLNIINDKLAPLSSEEEALLYSRTAKKWRVTALISTIAMGLISQAPFVYLAYKYNRDLFYPSLVGLIAASAFPIYSLYLSADKLLQMGKLPPSEEKLAGLKDKIVTQLTHFLNGLPNMSFDQQKALIEELKDLKEGSGELALQFMQWIFAKSSKPAPVPPEGTGIQRGRFYAEEAGIILAIADLLYVFILTYQGMQLLTDNLYLNVASGGLVVLCNLFLSFKINVESTLALYNTPVDLYRGTYQKSLIEGIYRKPQLGMRLICLVLAALSFSVPLKIWQDALSEGNFRTFMQVTTITIAILVYMYSLFALSDDLILFVGKRHGSRVNKALIHLSEEIQQLIKMIEKSSADEFLQFVKTLPEYPQWLQELQIDERELSNYLAPIHSSSTEQSPLLQV